VKTSRNLIADLEEEEEEVPAGEVPATEASADGNTQEGGAEATDAKE
jgi:large subunit ribosomal protein L25